MVQFTYGFDVHPARPPDHPPGARLPDPPTEIREVRDGLKGILFDRFFFALKMVQFPYGFDINPARSPHPCPTRLPDSPTAKLEVRF